MSKSIIVPLVCASVIFNLPVIASPTLSEARYAIQAALQASAASLHRKDIAGCMAGFTSDFRGEDIRGNRFTKEQTRQNLVKSFSFAQSIDAKTTVQSVNFTHGTAVVLSKEHTELTILGKRTHHLHTLVFDGLWQSTWVNTKAGWQEKTEKQLTSTVTTDGVSKVIQPVKLN